jgi:ribose-phosphate pyrophosphokinase
MITVNGKSIDVGSFPDGTILMKHDMDLTVNTHIEWRFENDREFLALIYLVKHLRNHGVDSLSLYMPYIPNARQDRVKARSDVFTLKYFAEILNSLDFNSVMVLDPHSNVSIALINKVTALFPKNYIEQAIAGINGGWVKYNTNGDKLLMF